MDSWLEIQKAKGNQQEAGGLLLELAGFNTSPAVKNMLAPLVVQRAASEEPDASVVSIQNNQGSAEPDSKRLKLN